MKSKEQIINEMCYASRHDYGIIKDEKDNSLYASLSSGMTPRDREVLYSKMEKLYNIVITNLGENQKPTNEDFVSADDFEILESEVCLLYGYVDETADNFISVQDKFEKLFESFRKEFQEKLDKKADRITFVSGTTTTGIPPNSVAQTSIGSTIGSTYYKRSPRADELRLINLAKQILEYSDADTITYKLAKAYLEQFTSY